MNCDSTGHVWTRAGLVTIHRGEFCDCGFQTWPEAQLQDPQKRIDELTLALTQALNGWGCYAKRDIEHKEIIRLREVLGSVRP